MELITHKKLKAGRLMPWGKAQWSREQRGLCSYNNPPPSEVIGVAALAHPELVIEIVAVAALPD